MRLSEVRKIITENRQILSIRTDKYRSDSTMLEVNNMHTVLTYLNNLKKIPSLEPHIISLYNDFPKLAAIYTSDMVVVKEDDFRGFYSRLEKISIKCDAILELAESILPQEVENTISIKLPVEISLSEIGLLAKDFSAFFDVLFSSPKLKECGSVKFYGVEAGSSWLYLLVPVSAMKIVNIIVDGIYNIYNSYLKIQHMKAELEKIKFENEMLSDIKKVVRALSENTVHLINDDQELGLDAESERKLSRNLENIIKLFNTGVRIYPSLAAPTEERNKTNEMISHIENLLTDINKPTLPETSDQEMSSDDDADTDD
ncbi:hypothetical protein [Selenomonas sp. oral taxon 149]|uniref:hypothetical protein n=1 Tax=Selenomonas sp. oral taxon 149 TaxID=712535 RepID=UPI0002E81BA3|nr:hypothetical protein [Selenomonas sp. oral taxon 149]